MVDIRLASIGQEREQFERHLKHPFFSVHHAGSITVSLPNCAIYAPKPAVGNSSPLLTNLPFHDFPKNLCSPNEDFGRPNKHSGTHFQSTFSNESSPNLVLPYVKSALKIRSRKFARPSKIFVWGALWRTKKSHFHASDEMHIKNVNKML